MRKNIFILVSVLSFLAVLFAIPVFNQISVNRVVTYGRYYDAEGYEKNTLTVVNDPALAEIDRVEFHQALNELAIKNNIVIWRLSIDTNEDSNHVRSYLSENDIFLNDVLLLREENDENLSQNVSFSSNATERKYQIPLFFSNDEVDMSSIVNNRENEGIYNLISLDKENPHAFDMFTEDLLNRYPDISIVLQQEVYLYHSADDFSNLESSLWEPMWIKMSLVLVLALLLCSKIFSLNRYISLLKIEGHSNFKIYCILFLVPFSLAAVVMVLALTLILFWYFRASLDTALCAAQLIWINQGQLFLMMILMSLLLYLIISCVSIMTSLKGKNHLDEVEMAAYAIKFSMAFLIVPVIVTSCESISDLFLINSRKDHVENLVKNYYLFDRETYSEYSQDMGSKNYIALRDDLVWNNGLFDQSRSYFFDDLLLSDKQSVYLVDRSYCLQVGLLKESDPVDEIYVFYNSETVMDQSQIEEKIRNSVRIAYPVHFVEYDFSLQSYNVNDLLYHDAIERAPLIYYPEESGLEGQLNYKIFYFDGTVDEAQEYIDQVFRMHGYAPQFFINSLESSYTSILNTYNSNLFDQVIRFVLLFTAFFLAGSFFIEVDLDNNRKKYMIIKTEGLDHYPAILYLVKFISADCLALLACFISGRIAMDSGLPIILAVIAGAELIMYRFFTSRIRKAKDES